MKLYLSSFQLGNHPEYLYNLLRENKKAAIIMNAADVFGDKERPKYLKQYASDLDLLGISSEELDLRLYFGKPDQLLSKLRNFGLIWATGGNSFVLRRAFQLSGFDHILPKLLQTSEIVYGGFSAGICVIAPSLRGIELVDDPYAIPQGYPSEII